MKIERALRRHGGLEDGVGALRAGPLGYEAEAPRDAMHVGVDGERGQAAGEEEHARARLCAHARDARETPVRRGKIEAAQST